MIDWGIFREIRINYVGQTAASSVKFPEFSEASVKLGQVQFAH
jgi:hypothetical protein